MGFAHEHITGTTHHLKKRIQELEAELAICKFHAERFKAERDELREATCTWRDTGEWEMPLWATECGTEFADSTEVGLREYVPPYCINCGRKLIVAPPDKEEG